VRISGLIFKGVGIKKKEKKVLSPRLTMSIVSGMMGIYNAHFWVEGGNTS